MELPTGTPTPTPPTFLGLADVADFLRKHGIAVLGGNAKGVAADLAEADAALADGSLGVVVAGDSGDAALAEWVAVHAATVRIGLLQLAGAAIEPSHLTRQVAAPLAVDDLLSAFRLPTLGSPAGEVEIDADGQVAVSPWDTWDTAPAAQISP